MREILLNRAAESAFDNPDTIGSLVDACGGHPRELLRLLRLCCEFSDESTITGATAERAIETLASEYRRFLEPEDYELLARVDLSPVHTGNDERTRRLLYNLALLEYNDGSWQASHPAVRRLAGYSQARERLVAVSEQ